MQAFKQNPDIQRLEEMIGESFLYRARPVIVKGYAINDDRVQIRTQGQPVLTSLDKLGTTLDELLPVQDEPDAGLKNTAVQVYQSNDKNIDKLENVLMDNIDKLKDSPEFIDQAKAIRDTANTILGMARVKIEMLREIRKYKDG